MSVSDTEIMSMGRRVRDKAVEKWLQTEADFPIGPSGGNDLLETYRAQVREAFDFIPTMFESHTQRNPGRIEEMRGHLESLRWTLGNPAVADLDTMKSRLHGWTGDAAYNFWHDYLGPFQDIKQNQIDLVNVLDGFLGGVLNMLSQDRQDIINIGERTLDALEAVQREGGGAGGISIGFSIIAAVAGAITAIPTAGTSTIVTAAVISGAASIGAEVADWQEQGAIPIGGQKVNDVIVSMVDANDKLWETVQVVESDLAELVSGCLDRAHQHAYYFQPIIPAVIGFDADDNRSPEILNEFEPPA